MGISTRIYKQNRNEKYNKWDLETSKRERALKKYADKEDEKTNPARIRLNAARKLTQEINNDQAEVFNLLYEKIDARAEELYNLIIKDLGLDVDEKATLTSEDILSVMKYYEDNGLNQIKNALPENIMKYLPNKLSPYQKLFKNLIAKRAEFLIVAPKERLSLATPFTKVKGEEMQRSLVRHLADLKIIQSYKFAERYPALSKMYDNMKNNAEI